MTAKKPAAHKWQFPSRIRPNTFSWRSSPTAAARIKDAVAEIKSASRNDPMTAAEGAIRLIERLSPALEHVDSSSGTLGSAVNRAIETLVPIISAADVPVPVRQKWLERLYEAHAAEGKPDEAIALAESLRGQWTPDRAVDRLCERILLDAGRIEEAYRRFGLASHEGGTYLATFREVAKTYPCVPREQILRDLIRRSPGDEGKWFTAAKELRLYNLALELVRDSPRDPKTLARAARDHAEREPAFAVGTALASLRWLTLGYGYEVTALDVWNAYRAARKAAEALGQVNEIQAIIHKLIGSERPNGLVRQVLGREVGLT